MKKIISTLALTLVLFSCSKDDDAASIYGTWDEYQIGTIAADGTITNLYEVENGCPTEKDNYTFSENGNFIQEELYDNSENDNKTNKSLACDSDTYSGTFVLDGKSLKINYANGDFVNVDNYEVVSMSSSELKIKTLSPVKNRLNGKIAMDNSNYYTFRKR